MKKNKKKLRPSEPIDREDYSLMMQAFFRSQGFREFKKEVLKRYEKFVSASMKSLLANKDVSPAQAGIAEGMRICVEDLPISILNDLSKQYSPEIDVRSEREDPNNGY